MKNAERFAQTPTSGYYAVIFTNTWAPNTDGYEPMAKAMADKALKHPGCLGMESTRDAFGFGITVSYWKDEASILEWKQDSSHVVAQNAGMKRWYDHYELRVAKVERSYSGPVGRTAL